MHSINVNLTPSQVLAIANAMNSEGKRFRDMATSASLRNNSLYGIRTPQQTIDIWTNAANDHFALTKDLIAAADNPSLNHHVPVTSDSFRGVRDAFREICGELVPGMGQCACTRPADHDGNHRCKASDVDQRRAVA